MRSDPGHVKKLTKLTTPLLLLAALSLAGCEGAEPEVAAAKAAASGGSYAGEGRDRMCLKSGEPEGGLITYAPTGVANCSLRFTVRYSEGSTSTGTLAAANDPACTISFTRKEQGAEGFTLGQPSPGCAYYCGPGARLDGKSFVRMDRAEPVTDLAGDPLC
jgi:hypothetical protein